MIQYTPGQTITVYPLKRVEVLIVTEDGKRIYADGKWHTSDEIEEYHDFIVQQFTKEKRQ